MRLWWVVLVGCGGGITAAPKDPVDSGDPVSDTDTDTDSDGDTDADAWSHTITVDGDVSDFLTEEGFATTGGTTSITWNETALYVGIDHTDVAAGSAAHWVQIYVGNGTGGTSGVQYNTQQPDLSAAMSHVVRWKADDSFNSLMTWSGQDWVDNPGLFGTGGSAWAEGSAVEFAIPFGMLGVTDAFYVHINWLYEGAGFETTYSPTPAGSHADEYDPDYGQTFLFERSGTQAPGSYTATP